MTGLLLGTLPALASTNKKAVKKPLVYSTKKAVVKVKSKKKVKERDVVTSTYIPGAPKGYMSIILTARNKYLKSSAQAKRHHSASALNAAEDEYNEALQHSNELLVPVSTSSVGASSSSQP